MSHLESMPERPLPGRFGGRSTGCGTERCIQRGESASALADNGLIELKEGVGLEATKNDIVKNDKNLKIVEIEAAQLPRSLGDVDIAVINGNYAIEAGLKVSDALLATEDSQSIAATTYGQNRSGSQRRGEIRRNSGSDRCADERDSKQYIEDTYQVP